MTRRLAGALGLALLALAAMPAAGGDNQSQSIFGSDFFLADTPCPVNNIPTFESIVPIPPIIDPFEDDFIPVFCQVQVSKNNTGVRKAKGKFTAELLVLDNNTGMTDSFSIDRGRFTTNASGFAGFDFEIPTEIFADGFESGDVSAWSYTRADFTNRKNANNTSVQCGTSSSSSR